jgi:hypothetical protein
LQGFGIADRDPRKNDIMKILKFINYF